MPHSTRTYTRASRVTTTTTRSSPHVFTAFTHARSRVADNGLQTEISTSKERCFPLITFIDTPGLVDGSFTYPFPVEDAIVAVAKHTDLIYIFFDPIGQALCDRTMKVHRAPRPGPHAEKKRNP